MRLRYGYIVRCIGAEKDADGNVTVVHCTYDPQTRSGTPGADARKVKGNIHWLSSTHALPAEVRLYDRLFAVPFPGARNPQGARAEGDGGSPRRTPSLVAGEDDDDEAGRAVERNYLDDLNPDSKRVITRVRRAGAGAEPLRKSAFQFERHGYFVADLARPRAGRAGVQPHGDAARFLGEAVDERGRRQRKRAVQLAASVR